ncbi:MAG: T9SS type A sorting domain-containing protein [Bacteroidales bacterium]|nr:T9SS type A sorting domain-containing protein [Bacteroidales bacterium]
MLLFATVATVATSALAQRSAAVSHSVVKHMAAIEAPEAQSEEVSFLSAEARGAHKVGVKADAVKAWYYRPAGMFYLSSYTTEGKAGYSTFFAPYLMAKPYVVHSFASASTGAVANKWKVWYKEDLQNASVEVDGEQIFGGWELEVDTVPHLTSTGADGAVSEYQIQGYNSNTAAMSVGQISTYPGYPGQIMPSTTTVRHIWASPKFFAAKSNRDYTVKAGAYYATVKDADGVAAGNLLGVNSVGLNAMGIAVEQPAHPYAISAVGVRFQSLAMASDAAEATFVANVYKLSSIPSYVDGYVKVQPGEKIATASFKVNNNVILTTPEFSKSSSTGKYSGIMRIPFDKVLHIEEPIFIEVTGYNEGGLSDFTALYSADYYEEGYGEIGYIKKDGEFISMRGSYINSARSTAPAVMMEVENAFLAYNSSIESGEVTFAAAGGEKEVDLFTYRSATEMKLTAADGSALPQWLTASVEDDTQTGSFSLLSTLKVNVAPLPDGVTYREADVLITIPGAKLVYKVKQQGEEPTAIDDVKASGIQAKVMGGDFVITAAADSPVQIYNVAGQLVSESRASQGTSVIGAQHLAPGVYLVKVGGSTVKVVK